jgi:hypothetical protein
MVRRKNAAWMQAATTVAAAREAACKLVIGQEPSPGEWQRVPDYARPALEALRPERSRYQSSRLVDVPKPDEPGRWFLRLVTEFSSEMTAEEVDLGNYAKCSVLSPSVFTDASLKAARRKFKVFPAPAPLRKFLIDWGEEHRSWELPDEDQRHRSLVLTNAERQHLLTAEAVWRNRIPIPDGPVKRLTRLHVRIAHILASWQRGEPPHEQLALAAGTSVRTVRRALPALRTLGLLPDGIRGLSRTEMPKRVSGFQSVMAVIAAHAGCSVKTLYRWEQDYRALQGKPRRMEWRRPKGMRARRMRAEG